MAKAKRSQAVPRLGSAMDFSAVRNFMVAKGGLELPHAELIVYSIVFQYSVDNAGCFYGSTSYLMNRCNLSRPSVVNALRSLCSKGLLKEVGSHRQGDNRNTKKYVADMDAAQAACDAYDAFWAEEVAEGAVVENFGGDHKETASELVIIENYPSGKKTLPDCGKTTVENRPSGKKTLPDQVKFFSSKCDVSPGQRAKIAPYKKEYKKDIQPTVHPTGSVAPSAPKRETGSAGRADGKGSGSSDRAFERIASASVTRSLLGRAEGVARPRRAFAALLAEGVSAAGIEAAWEARLKRAAAECTSSRHYPQLLRWLESDAPDGARAMAASLAEQGRGESSRQRSVRMSLAAAADPELGELVERARSLQLDLERHGVGTRELVGSAWAAARERFDEIEQSDHRNRSANILQT